MLPHPDCKQFEECKTKTLQLILNRGSDLNEYCETCLYRRYLYADRTRHYGNIMRDIMNGMSEKEPTVDNVTTIVELMKNGFDIISEEKTKGDDDAEIS